CPRPPHPPTAPRPPCLLPRRRRLFFLLMTRRPPTPTLFPYTTLFRSGHHIEAASRNQVAVGLVHPVLHQSPAGPQGRIGHDQVVDRKSTRLKSSHVKISYAVFCLKKKKEGAELAFASVAKANSHHGAV